MAVEDLPDEELAPSRSTPATKATPNVPVIGPPTDGYQGTGGRKKSPPSKVVCLDCIPLKAIALRRSPLDERRTFISLDHSLRPYEEFILRPTERMPFFRLRSGQ